MISVEADFNFEGFEKEAVTKLNLFPISQKELEEIGNIVVTDIKQGIETGIDLNGAPFRPNTPEWIKRKSNDTVYIGKTKSLFNSIKSKLFGVFNAEKNDGAIIEISARGGGLHWQTNPKSPGYKRDFFGISERASKAIGEFLRRKFG